MKPLRIARRELFAQLLVSGETQADAYRRAYRYTGTERNAKRLAHRLAVHPDIAARVRYMQKRASDLVNFALQKRLAYLMDAILTPPDRITASSPFCQGVRMTAHGPELKLIDKRAALELYSRLVGDFKDRPEPVRQTPLGEIINRIRARREP